MNGRIERARLLMSQSRYDRAADELREVLATDPNDPQALALLALCHSGLDAKGDAVAAGRAAVAAAPDEPFCHYALGCVLHDANDSAGAYGAAEEALRLDPDAAHHWGLLAALHLGRRRWAEALDAANRGLELDAESSECRNLRALALVQLGRRDEAGETIAGALARDPENATTHANQGWTALHKRDHRGALEHFGEALRLEPDNEWARQGMLEGLRARYLVYRAMLAYFLWSSRLSRRMSWVLLIGGYLTYRVLLSSARSMPAWRPVLVPLAAVLLAFFVLTWTAQPVFNSLLRLNRFGRLVLNDRERLVSNCFLALVALAVALGVVWWLRDVPVALFGAIAAALMIIPVTHALSRSNPAHRKRLGACAAGLAGIAAIGLAGVGLQQPSLAAGAGLLFLVGFVGYQFYANAMAIHR